MRGRGNHDQYEPHGTTKSAGRIESNRRCEVLLSSRRQAIWGNDAHDADDNNGENSDEQRGNSHMLFIARQDLATR